MSNKVLYLPKQISGYASGSGVIKFSPVPKNFITTVHQWEVISNPDRQKNNLDKT